MPLDVAQQDAEMAEEIRSAQLDWDLELPTLDDVLMHPGSDPLPREDEEVEVEVELPDETEQLLFFVENLAEANLSNLALGGADGQRAGELLEAKVSEGAAFVNAIAEGAVARLLEEPDPLDHTMLFTDEELDAIAKSFASSKAIADLMGRMRMRKTLEYFDSYAPKSAMKATKFAEGYRAFKCGKCVGGIAYDGDPERKTHYHGTTKCVNCSAFAPQSTLQFYEQFADDPVDPSYAISAPTDTFAPIVDVPPALRPNAAIGYFQKLVPSLGVRAARFGPLLDRQAFTLAVGLDEVLLGKVKGVIQRQLVAGDVSDPAGQIRKILEAAGVAPANPQYSEMVYRTNIMDSYNQGQQAEYSTPEMQNAFPAWEYHAVTLYPGARVPDSRGRPWHAAKNGLLWPASIPFTEVRGTDGKDVYNCRCGWSPVYKRELDRRLAAGDVLQGVN